jgi:hypothetical protein
MAALVYVAITALMFRNLLPNLSTHLYSDLGDPLLNAAILAWNAKQVPLTEAWWNFPSFAPLSGVTTFTEHLLLAYPIASPIIWATGNPILANNIVFLASPVLNGVAAYALARELTQSSAAAFIAGLAFAFAPYQSVQLSHIQEMMSFGMPVALLGLHRYLGPAKAGHYVRGEIAVRREIVGAEWRGLALFGVGWFVTALSNAYTLVFFPLVVAMWCAWFLRPREWRRLVPLVVTAIVVVLPLVPLLWGYHVRHVAYGLVREYNEIRSFSADMVGLVGMYHRASPWRGILPHDFEEGALFPGFTILALASLAMFACVRPGSVASPAGPAPQRTRSWSHRLLIASGVLTIIVLARVWTGYWGWHFGPIPLPPFQPMHLFTVAFVIFLAGALGSETVRRGWRRRDPAIFYALAVVMLWLLALGPEPAWSKPWRALWFGPYRLLIELPGFDSVRVPARTWLPAVLCLAMLAGFGTAAILRRYSRHRRMLVTALAAAIVFEGWCFDGTMMAPRPMRAGAIPPGAVVLDLPMEEGYWNAVPEYRAVLGGYRTINGYSGYEPPHFTPLRHAIAELDPGPLNAYRRSSDLYLIIRPGENGNVARWLTTQRGTEHLFDIDQARIYRMARLQE